MQKSFFLSTNLLLSTALMSRLGVEALSASSPFDPHYALYPKSYVVQRVDHTQITVDGNIEKQVWQNVPWSEPFADIQGDDAPNNGRSPAMTRFKALYSDSHLYIAAELHPSPGMPTAAHFDQRNSPIFQKDSDFEVFIDTAGSTHQYKELEVNAWNTVWNLCLDKPYRDGGREHSGRVATDPSDPLYYEVYEQQTATRVVQGKLNDAKEGAWWTVEIALSYKDLMATVDTANEDDKNSAVEASRPPTPGTRWRINFSRVEEQGAINWTWQAQRRWDPARNRFCGFIDMHLPDAWGYLVFSSSTHDDKEKKEDATWPAQLAAMSLYYAQHEHLERTGSFAASLADLKLPTDIVEPFEISIHLLGRNSFLITVVCSCHNVKVTVRDDRLLRITTSTSDDDSEVKVD